MASVTAKGLLWMISPARQARRATRCSFSSFTSTMPMSARLTGRRTSARKRRIRWNSSLSPFSKSPPRIPHAQAAPAHRHTGHDLEGLFHAPSAHRFGGQRLGLIEKAHQPRFELVGQKIPDRPHIEDRRRALIKPGPDDIEKPVRFTHLGAANHDNPLVVAGMDCPHHRNNIRRDRGITRAR